MQKKKEKKPEVDEGAIARAIHDYRSGEISSIRKSAETHGLVYQTLRNRLNGVLPRPLAHVKEQLLSPEEEDEIVEWIKASDEKGEGRSRSDVLEYAELFLLVNKEQAHISDAWFERFKKRHKKIHIVQGRSLSSLRAKAATVDKIKGYFSEYRQIVREHHIPDENIFNYDESGFIMGQGNSSKVAVPSYKNRTYVKSTEGRDSCTVIEAISMTGEALIPSIIFKGKTLRTGWIADDAPDYYYSVSKCGYTSYWLSWRWLEEVFIPQVKKRTTNGKILLIMDGHGSHKTKKFRETCEENSIIPLYLPPHSTHLLQPLDLGIFGPLKSEYKTKLKKLAGVLCDRPIRQRFFIMKYAEARKEKLTSERIIRSWETAGLNPIDPDKVLKSSQLIVEQINNEIDGIEIDVTENNEHDSNEIGPNTEDLTEREYIEFLEKELKSAKSEITHLKAQLALSKFNESRSKEASQNKTPPGVSSAIPMDENQGFKRAAPYVKNLRQNPPKKGKRKALQDITNLSNGENSYTNSCRN